MGILDKYIEENNLNTDDSKTDNKTVNIPLKLTGYEDDMFVGIRMDTKEVIKVKMRDVEQKGDFTRPSVEDFSNKHSKRFAPVNSILMLESSYEESDGIWNTRWATTLSLPKRPSKVAVLDANINIKKGRDNTYVEANIIKKQTTITDINELQKAMMEAFTSTVYRSKNFVIIRLKEISSGEVFNFEYAANLVDADDGDGGKLKVMDTPENSYNKFLADTSGNKVVFDLIDNDDIEIDVFFCTRLFCGADTNKKITENDYQLKYFKEEYDGYNKFKKTIISVRTRADGSAFIVALKPLVNNEDAKTIKQLGEK